VGKDRWGLDGTGQGGSDARAYSADLRERVIAACVEGLNDVARRYRSDSGSNGHRLPPFPVSAYPTAFMRRNTPSAIPTYGVSTICAALRTRAPRGPETSQLGLSVRVPLQKPAEHGKGHQ
jgi:hypothetical protein